MAEKSNEANGTTEKISWEAYTGPHQPLLADSMPHYANLVTLHPANTMMTSLYLDYMDQYNGFQCKSEDIWVATFPKCGTTWSQEMVWTLLHGLDHPDRTKLLTARAPFFEWDCLFEGEFSLDHLPDDDLNKTGVMWDLLLKMRSPRSIKTHLHRDLLPPSLDVQKSRLLYVARDPRDVCISLYFHSVKLDGYTGTFDQFVDLFLDDVYPWMPYWSHVLGYWKQRSHSNVLFITFEDLKKDLPGSLDKVAAFLGVDREGCRKGVLTDDERSALVDHLSFASMSKNPAVNNEALFASCAVGKGDAKNVKFMRKGKVGDHKNHLSQEQLERFATWTKKALGGSDFPYYRDY